MAAADNTHSPTAEDIMEFLDGEGTAASRTAIEAHLAGCAACQAIASEHRQLSLETNAWAVEPAPASLHAPRPPRRRLFGVSVPPWFPMRTAAGLALVATVLVGIVVIESFRVDRLRRRMVFLNPYSESDRSSGAVPDVAPETPAMPSERGEFAARTM